MRVETPKSGLTKTTQADKDVFKHSTISPLPEIQAQPAPKQYGTSLPT